MNNVAGKRVLSILVLLIGLLPVLSFAQPAVSIAVLPFENMNGDKEQDYLKGIISSLLAGDISGSGDVAVVERDKINDIMKEQQLQFTGLMDEKAAIKAGRLLGASLMLKGSYVFLGKDLFINVSLINVETGESISFSGRGYRENTIHTLSEKILNHITGKEYSFVNNDGNRSILAVKQLEPGKVELFSPITKAKVFLDDTFVGYTKGNSSVPLVLKVAPGDHKIRVHLDKEFGVVELPEVTFHDWEQEFSLMPGDTVTLEDKTRHFSDHLRRIRKLLDESFKVPALEGRVLKKHYSLEFTDRNGVQIPIELDVLMKEAVLPSEGGRAEITLRYKGDEHDFSYFVPLKKGKEFKEDIGKIRLDVSFDWYPPIRCELRYSIYRTDIQPGMYRQ